MSNKFIRDWLACVVILFLLCSVSNAGSLAIVCIPGEYISGSACLDCPGGTYSSGMTTSCSDCSAGYYSEVGSTSSDCSICAAGTYSNNRASSCTNCAGGTYSAGGASSCTSCSAGYYSSAGSSSCYQCGAGTYSTGGASSCTNCAAGYYSSTVGATSSSVCLMCSAGTYSTISVAGGASSCTSCSAGYYSSAGASSCSQCGAGTYSAVSSSSCTNCAAGSYSSAGSSSCTSCSAGYRSSAGSSSCSQCGAGTYSAGGASSCTSCSAGYYSSAGSSSCSQCGAGTYSAGGASSCTNCGAGTYSSTVGGTSSSVCLNCVAGTYSTISGATSATVCQNCNAGSFSTGGSSSCTNCAAGYYSASGSSSCSQCGAGTYSTGGSSSCASCAAGSYSSAGSSSCTSCSAGYYSNPGSSSCSQCGAGTYSSTGSSSCTSCSAGYYSNSGSSSCSQCGAGTYSTGGSSGCTSCSAGYYSSAGSSSCSQCGAGTYSTGGASSCTSCLAGYYSSAGSSSCSQCGAGTYSTGGSSSCTNCGAGTYSSTPGATNAGVCLTCSAGYYSSVGASSCSKCSAGTYSSSGSSSCTNCAAGYYSTSGSSSCSQCGAGTYSTGGSSSCTSCSAGYYSSAGSSSCSQCGAGTYSSTGSSSCTSCSAGYYSTSGSSSCSQCGAGTYSTGGSSSCTICSAGYRSSAGSSSCSQCGAGTFSTGGSSSCANCTAGSYSSVGSSNCTSCLAGYYSSTGSSSCSQCGAGTYSTSASSNCSSCGAGSYSSAGASSCSQCGAGTYSAGGASSCTNCGAGTYSSTVGGTNSSVCLNCVAGTYSFETGAASANVCQSCRAGTYSSMGSSNCTNCTPGFYSTTVNATSSATCIPCSAGTFSNSTGASYCFQCPEGTNSASGSSLCNSFSCFQYNNCSGNGVCVSNNTCSCFEGFDGLNCNISLPFSINLNSSYVTLSTTKIFTVLVVGNYSDIIRYDVFCMNCSFLNFTTSNNLITIDMTGQNIGKFTLMVVATMNNSRISAPSSLIVEIVPLINPPSTGKFGFLSIPKIVERNNPKLDVIISNLTDVDESFVGNCGLQTMCSFKLTTYLVEQTESSSLTLWTQSQVVVGSNKYTTIFFTPLVSLNPSLTFTTVNSTTLLLYMTLESSNGNNSYSTAIPIVDSAFAPTNINFTSMPQSGPAIQQIFSISSSPWNAPLQIQPLFYSYGIYLSDTQQYIQLSPFTQSTQAYIPLPYLSDGPVSVAIFVKNSLGNIISKVLGQVTVIKSIGNVDYLNLTDTQLAVSVFDQSSQLTTSDISTIIRRIDIGSNPDSPLLYLNTLVLNNILDGSQLGLLSNKLYHFLNNSAASYEQEMVNFGFVKSKLSEEALNSTFSIISTIISNSTFDGLLTSFSQLVIQSSIPKVVSDSDMTFISYSSNFAKASLVSFVLPSTNYGYNSNSYFVSPTGMNFSVTLNFTEITSIGEANTHGLSIITFSNNSKLDNYSISNQMLSNVADFKYFLNNSYVKLRNLNNPIILKFDVQSEVIGNISNPSLISCMYWDETFSIWSTEGCTLVGWSNSSVFCGCNHTTSFATFIDYNLSSIATIGEKTQVSGLFIAQIFFGCLFAVISFVMLILLVIFRKHQPVSSRLITPYMGMIALLVECISIFIIQRSVLVDYLWNNNIDWSSGTNAPNVIANITLIIVNSLNITAIFCYVWQTIRYEVMKYLYDLISKRTDNHPTGMKVLRRFVSQTLFISLTAICLTLNIAYWLLWVILRRTEAISATAFTQITSISYTVIIFVFSAIISVTTIVDVIAALIGQDIYFKRKVHSNNKILKESTSSLEMQLALAPHPKNKFFHTDAPLYFRTEMIAYVICFALMIVQQVTGLSVYSNSDAIVNIEIVNLVFQLLYYISFIGVFGGFSLTVLLIYRKKSKKSSHDASELNEIINEVIGLQLFEVFCESEFSTENLYLYQLLKENENINSEANIMKLSTFVRTIFELFIQRNSKYEVNIPSSVSTNFKHLINILESTNIELQQDETNSPLKLKSKEVFSDLLDQILLNLEDTFSRFVTLDVYERYKEKKDWKTNMLAQSNISVQ
ncbi:predicted protein [Naegleria gruberi]|uniref:Predicted protein n=1 Tax=Naegleria gruberi TaxID=5762 RepID=D2W1J3_NAEGR|nr:uncharacterized protein NAEGRDRAFT_75241 [Naegleria gruberi]EFC37054.1 predicted protein [Naegleria gruberi]|eukprot:XP_002669798.1 predicted protein [Naegleria gruberi strain NEG-M]